MTVTVEKSSTKCERKTVEYKKYTQKKNHTLLLVIVVEFLRLATLLVIRYISQSYRGN
jgi:hypothetical protein